MTTKDHGPETKDQSRPDRSSGESRVRCNLIEIIPKPFVAQRAGGINICIHTQVRAETVIGPNMAGARGISERNDNPK